MGMVARGQSQIHSAKRKPATAGTDVGALRVDVDIRLKGTGLTITSAQIVAAIASLATLGWAVMHFH